MPVLVAVLFSRSRSCFEGASSATPVECSSRRGSRRQNVETGEPEVLRGGGAGSAALVAVYEKLIGSTACKKTMCFFVMKINIRY